MVSVDQLEKRVSQIEQRNQRVETDKAWETSYARRILLIIITYLSIGLYMWLIGVSQPWLNAIIPSLGFLLSTLTLSYFKKLWVNNYQIHAHSKSTPN